MPELPEVETVRLGLHAEAVGKSITSAEIHGHRTVRRHDPSLLVDAIVGRVISGTRRHGKFLLVDLEEVTTLAIHLRMSGQLLWVPDPSTPLVKHTHARIGVDSAEVRFIDPRTFGELWVTTPDTPELSHFGPDALTGLTSVDALQAQLGHRRMPLKAALLNQSVVAGIGNIYANEILWRSELAPTRSATSLTPEMMERLFVSIGTVLSEAVNKRGSTLADAQYVDFYGRAGTTQQSFAVHARENQPCPRCDAIIVRQRIVGRSAYSCPGCQI